jgi:hypothetical protein
MKFAPTPQIFNGFPVDVPSHLRGSKGDSIATQLADLHDECSARERVRVSEMLIPKTIDAQPVCRRPELTLTRPCDRLKAKNGSRLIKIV